MRADAHGEASEVERYYDRAASAEWERLDRHRIELALSLRLLLKHLPTPPAAVLDIGGGPGRYAIELTRRGYAVTLVDLSRTSLALANEKAAEAGVRLVGSIHANALDLRQFASGAYDAALLMGPLYHLFTREDRGRAVAEAARVVRPAGMVFASVITRSAPIRWAARFQPDWLIEHREVAEAILENGVAVDTGGATFTDAYHAHPSELALLLEGAGLEVLDVVSCEGAVAMIDEAINALNGERWEAWVELNERLSRDPSLLGAAAHVLAVGRASSDR
jgi:S-adenosylmethionine-dependent methyltransferase